MIKAGDRKKEEKREMLRKIRQEYEELIKLNHQLPPTVRLHPMVGGVGGVMWCSVVECGVVWCGVVWCGVVWCGVVWCGVVWCGGVWCGVVWCGVVWLSVV